MVVLFYISAIVAVVSTVMVITRYNAVHALLYLVVSLLSAASIFFLLGAPFVAALEIIIYAGAIMVLFIFVIMMLNLGKQSTAQEKSWLEPNMWIGPSILAVILGVEMIYIIFSGTGTVSGVHEIPPRTVALNLYGPYLIGVELAAMLLLAGIIGAYHLGRRKRTAMHRFLLEENQ
jgi:NADH-quinone oxidoreductase subunit J